MADRAKPQCQHILVKTAGRNVAPDDSFVVPGVNIYLAARRTIRTQQQYALWVVKGVFGAVCKILPADPDFEYTIIDGTIVRVHFHTPQQRAGHLLRFQARRTVQQWATS